MALLLISNDSSGSSDASALAKVEEVLGRTGEVVHVRPGSLDDFDREIAATAAGVDLVVVAGGDGTLNCTVNALSSRLGDITFGLIPMGTGNDLARTLDLPRDPVEAAEVIVAGKERKLDVGLASGAGEDGDAVRRLFVNACIGGFPVQVDEGISDRLKAFVGAPAYAVAAVKELSEMERSTITLDGVQVHDCVAVGVGNGMTCGGGTPVWPDADPSDGRLDACALSAENLTDLLKLGVSVKRGSHGTTERASTSRGSSIAIDADPPVEMNVDGELVGLRTPVTFEVVGTTRIRATT